MNLSVTNSVFSNTGNPGTSPEAGVDLCAPIANNNCSPPQQQQQQTRAGSECRARLCREPNQPSDRMAGIVFRNCTTAGNVGDGFNINLHMLDLPCPGAQAPSKTAPCGRPEEVSAPA